MTPEAPCGKLNIAWAFTGAGHFLRESVEMLGSLDVPVDVFLSRAASEVLAMYGLKGRLDGCASSVTEEDTYSFAVTSRLAVGKYAALIISPATSNTVAKCLCGIADSLVSCMYAQAGKSRVPICVLPTDVAPDIVSQVPNGNRIHVYPRPIDLEQTARLREIRGVTAVSSPDELHSWLELFINKKSS
ncbi:MAG: flavoprotein [Synergistaceae bacterium]|jgi:flavoprotein|nr:flavoprotein [Synergistaceae bacterium]